MTYDSYDPKTTPWAINEADFPHNASTAKQMAFLLRYAILAPSSHNTQPWQFAIQDTTISIFADLSRWLQVADADKRELHISIGCAIENLLIAADHFGYRGKITYLPNPDQPDLKAIVDLSSDEPPKAVYDSVLFAAIPTRHTNHKVYQDQSIPTDTLQRLEACCTEQDISLFLTDDMATKERVEALITEGDARQFADSAYREELGYWIGQGVFGAPWLLAKMGQLAVTYINMGKNIAKQDVKVLLSAPVLGVVATQTDHEEIPMRVGQVFERVSLMATALGLQIHPMSQPLELPDLRQQVASLLPTAGLIPQHTFRLGYAEPEPSHTPRRPLTEVLRLW
jgi:nitroreductase